MADFCKKCEIEMFGKTYNELANSEMILCEGCGGWTFYSDVICKNCKTLVKSSMYDTGLEQYCKCQCTLDAEFKLNKWVDSK